MYYVTKIEVIVKFAPDVNPKKEFTTINRFLSKKKLTTFKIKSIDRSTPHHTLQPKD